MQLAGKRIVVTGAAGIAAAAAGRLSSEGGSVYVVSIDPGECARLASNVEPAGWTASDLSDDEAAVDAVGADRSCR